MKYAFGRHGHVHNFGILHFHDREKDALDGVSHEKIFLRRGTYDRREIKGVAALRPAGRATPANPPFKPFATGAPAAAAFRAYFLPVAVSSQANLAIRTQ